MKEQLCERTLEYDGFMTNEKQMQLWKRFTPGLSVEGQWFRIYGILFPGLPPPTSVLLDLDLDLRSYIEFTKSQGPKIQRYLQSRECDVTPDSLADGLTLNNGNSGQSVTKSSSFTPSRRSGTTLAPADTPSQSDFDGKEIESKIN